MRELSSCAPSVLSPYVLFAWAYSLRCVTRVSMNVWWVLITIHGTYSDGMTWSACNVCLLLSVECSLCLLNGVSCATLFRSVSLCTLNNQGRNVSVQIALLLRFYTYASKWNFLEWLWCFTAAIVQRGSVVYGFDRLKMFMFYVPFSLQDDTLQAVREIISEQLGTDIEKVLPWLPVAVLSAAPHSLLCPCPLRASLVFGFD